MDWANPTTQIRYRMKGNKTLIEIRLNQSRQLFDNRDPSPFIFRDLDQDAVDYLVGAVSELKSNSLFELVIHVSDEPTDALPEKDIRQSIHSFFKFQTQLIQSRIQQTFRRARLAFGVGLILLFSCLAVANILRSALPVGLARDVMGEGFTIIGWVAMWKPLELFFYDWWPLTDTRKIHERLSRCEVAVVDAKRQT